MKWFQGSDESNLASSKVYWTGTQLVLNVQGTGTQLVLKVQGTGTQSSEYLVKIEHLGIYVCIHE